MLRSTHRLVALAVMLAALVGPAAAQARSADRNHDGIPDKWEKKNHLSVHGRAVAKQDPDKDGLTNAGEFRSHTNPHLADTNHNGVGDASEDPDHDGVDNDNELREHTDPLKADTNHNGRKDGLEDPDHDRLNNHGEDQAGDETPGDGGRARIGLDGILGGRGADSGDDSNAGDATGSLDDNPGSGASGDGGDSTGADSSGADCTTADLAVGVVVHEASITA